MTKDTDQKQACKIRHLPPDTRVTAPADTGLPPRKEDNSGILHQDDHAQVVR